MVAARTARWRGNADGRREERGVFIGAARLRGDGSATGDAAVVPGLDRRVYGGAPPTDRRSVARAQPVRHGQTAARGPGGLQGASGPERVGKARPETAGCLGRRGLGRGR
jgi:hypothetical protein